MITCKICGSEDVQLKSWVNPNTFNICQDFFEFDNDITEYWCCECDENVRLHEDNE